MTYTQADLDAAVAAERERCAKVAEGVFLRCKTVGWTYLLDLHTADLIAAAIREVKP